MHYTSAHHYDPARAAIGDFTPFWEFVSGPLNAGAFGLNALDTTFGPQTVFSAAPSVANTSPADGFQFFGYVTIDGHTDVMTPLAARPRRQGAVQRAADAVARGGARRRGSA